MNVKQVIVMRRDLKIRRGKEIAQAAHASMEFIRRRIVNWYDGDSSNKWVSCEEDDFNEAETKWLGGQCAKIVVQVDSLEEMLELHRVAKSKALNAYIITDAGKTEFNGIPTMTCLAIGPDKAEDIDKITGHLKLY
jgi:PTH2 family peptidyl-tRNA hydrolase